MSRRLLHSGFKDISIDGQKIMSKSKSSKAKVINDVQNKSESDMVSLKSIIDSRHRGSWGNNLTAKQKTALYNATAVFLRANNLPVGEKLQHLQISRASQEMFNDYLDYLVDQDLFASPRGRSSPQKTFNEKILLDACKKLQGNLGSTKKISFQETDESDPVFSSSKNTLHRHPATSGSDNVMIQDSDTKVAKINKVETKRPAVRSSARKSTKRLKIQK